MHEYIKLHGGKIICGYRVWYNEPRYIELERHAIWEHQGQFRDVSFSADGEKRFLFVPDVLDRQSTLESNSRRRRWSKDYPTKKLVGIQESMESRMEIRQMADDEAWNTMLTYEQWLEGKRMPSLLPLAQ